MNKFRTLLTIGSLMLCLAVNAQEMLMPPEPRIATKWMLVNIPDVQMELGLNKSQLSKLQRILKEAEYELMNLHGGEEMIEDIESFIAEMEEGVKALDAKYEKRFKGILTKKQDDRFNQIELQLNGPMIMIRDDIVKKLGLSTSQIAQIQETINDFFMSMSVGGHGSSKDEWQEITENLLAQALSVLNSKQQKLWKQMIGKKFVLENIGYSSSARSSAA